MRGSKWRWGRILLALAGETEFRVGDKVRAQPMERYNFQWLFQGQKQTLVMCRALSIIQGEGRGQCSQEAYIYRA